eukprot:TRINITY_DN8120_c0_g1_i2.p1 TRINITY_DN8120_c0_g1~~TRINITY_DN8120_c0_g1_i2.p1  ORF type:complete len:281 (-),score=26.64 TRINITY_DN8120_c0_g1_i2:182-1024(-)
MDMKEERGQRRASGEKSIKRNQASTDNFRSKKRRIPGSPKQPYSARRRSSAKPPYVSRRRSSAKPPRTQRRSSASSNKRKRSRKLSRSKKTRNKRKIDKEHMRQDWTTHPNSSNAMISRWLGAHEKFRNEAERFALPIFLNTLADVQAHRKDFMDFAMTLERHTLFEEKNVFPFLLSGEFKGIGVDWHFKMLDQHKGYEKQIGRIELHYEKLKQAIEKGRELSVMKSQKKLESDFWIFASALNEHLAFEENCCLPIWLNLSRSQQARMFGSIVWKMITFQ